MNKILNLLDEKYVSELFNREVLPLYPDFEKIKGIKIIPVKKNIWTRTYHVVIEFLVGFLDKNGQLTELAIYCNAHSEEPRKNSYEALSFLWSQGFNEGHLTVPHPLFFSEDFNGYFYRGVQGNNLYYYIREGNLQEIENIVPRAAAWFAKLHGLPAEKAKNFNQINSRIETVIPGYELIFTKLSENYPEHYEAYKQVFEYVKNQENQFLKNTDKRWLIHGDAHPENVIKMSEQTLAVIDFTDVCLSDFARDLGTFLQQFEYMSIRKLPSDEYIKKIQKLFLESYLKASGEKLDNSLQKRIDCYYAWTALRTTTLFLLKESPEPERAHELLLKVRQYLKLD